MGLDEKALLKAGKGGVMTAANTDEQRKIAEVITEPP